MDTGDASERRNPWPDGTLLQVPGDVRVWLVVGNVRYHVISWDALDCSTWERRELVPISAGQLQELPEVPPDGSVIAAGVPVYYIDKGLKFYVRTADELIDDPRLGAERVIYLPDGSLNRVHSGGNFPPRPAWLLKTRLGRATLTWLKDSKTRTRWAWVFNQFVAFLLGVAATILTTRLLG